MEQDKTLNATLPEYETDDMEPVIERINGLEELLMIVTDETLQNTIREEVAALKARLRFPQQF